MINRVNKDNWNTLMKSLMREAQGLNINATKFTQLLNIILDGMMVIVLPLLETSRIHSMHEQDIVAKVEMFAITISSL